MTNVVLSRFVDRRVLHPQYRIPYLKLWSSHYVNQYRYDHVHDASKAAELQALKLEEVYKVRQRHVCNHVVVVSFCFFTFSKFVPIVTAQVIRVAKQGNYVFFFKASSTSRSDISCKSVVLN